MTAVNSQLPKQIQIKEGLLTMPLTPYESVGLVGSKCRNCGEVFLGRQMNCLNCSGEDMEEIRLSNKGKLWTYSVIRYRPPGDYKGPDPFVPFGLGLVELPDGIRILSPIECDIDKIKIGMDLLMKVHELYQDKEGNSIVAFKFRPV